tara:strand:+ start:392 stop:502 length:111 start_codon:yes stop_codon:yes gene_type:complete
MHIEEYIEELLKAAGFTEEEIKEMDLPEKRMHVGYD